MPLLSGSVHGIGAGSPAEGWVRGVAAPGEHTLPTRARLPSASERWSRPLDARQVWRCLPRPSGQFVGAPRPPATARRRAAAKAVRLSVRRRAGWCSSAFEPGRGLPLGDVSTALYGVGEHGLRAGPWARFAVPGSRAGMWMCRCVVGRAPGIGLPALGTAARHNGAHPHGLAGMKRSWHARAAQTNRSPPQCSSWKLKL